MTRRRGPADLNANAGWQIVRIGCPEHWSGSQFGGILIWMSDVTKILSQIEQGDPSAAEELLPLVYEELRKLARAKLAREKSGQTLQATALVHEAYLRLIEHDSPQEWDGRRHFFAAASESMRRILVEQARRKSRLKRGGDREREDLRFVETKVPDDELLALDEAIACFSAEHAEKAELVKFRYFVGMTIPQAAEAMGISKATADRHWSYARAWLFRYVRRGDA